MYTFTRRAKALFLSSRVHGEAGRLTHRGLLSGSIKHAQIFSRQAVTTNITSREERSVQLQDSPWLVLLMGAASGLAIASAYVYRVGNLTSERRDTAARQGSHTASTLPLLDPNAIQYDTSQVNIDGAIREFQQLLGHENINTILGERKSRSSTAWSPAPREDDIPSVIVFPRSTQDVSEIVKICHRRRIPMIGFAGGTSLEGTLAAQHAEVCLDFNRHMNKVLAVRKDDMDITVQPSVGYVDLNALLAQQGLFFPVDPGPGAQIGGMISMGCSGTNAYRYGTMKDWVLGLEVVLADGTIINTRARPRKSSSGYDLTRLFVGAEGTLGFVTKAHLKITRAPDNLRVAVAQFPTVHDAVRMAVKIIQSGHQLEAMELLDERSMKALNLGGSCSVEWDEKPTLFFKVAGPSPADVEKTATIVEQISQTCNSAMFRLAADEAEGDEIWAARKTALWSQMAMRERPDDQFLSADACVPISRLADIITQSQEIFERAKVVGFNLGHVGDGNFHASILYHPEDEVKARKIISDIQDLSVDMDGTISGEHGIGVNFRDKVVRELGQDTVDAMRQIKIALDPLCLLNPGKMIRLTRETSDL